MNGDDHTLILVIKEKLEKIEESIEESNRLLSDLATKSRVHDVEIQTLRRDFEMHKEEDYRKFKMWLAGFGIVVSLINAIFSILPTILR